MATVHMSRFEVQEGRLPPVCLKCGAPATGERAKTFSWHPPWVLALILLGLLPFAIVALVLTKRMTVHAPMCAAHQNHWSWRAWVTWLGLALLVGLGFVAIALLGAAENQRGPGNALAGAFCGSVVVAGLAWLITVAILQMCSIRPTEITNDSITLMKVSRAFEDALWEERDRRGGWEPEGRRPQRYRDDEDAYREEPRRPREPRRHSGDDDANREELRS